MIKVTYDFTCDVCKQPSSEPFQHAGVSGHEFPKPFTPVYDFRIHTVGHMLCVNCARPLIKLLGEMYGGRKPEDILTSKGYTYDETRGDWV